MSISEPFVRRPVATTLLTIAIALGGIVAFRLLPVAPLPEVDFPTIQVNASLPGASPETMASSVAAPLERQFGHIASLTELTSSSSLGATNVVLQFDLSRDIDAAARDVQAAINAARSQLPSNLPGNPTYRKVNPADAPILILGLTSDSLSRGQMYDSANSVLAQKLSQISGVGQVVVGGGASPAVRVELNPTALNDNGIGLEDVRTALGGANVNHPKGAVSDGKTSWSVGADDQILKAVQYRPLIIAYHNGAAVKLSDVAEVLDSVQDVRNAGMVDSKPGIMIIIFRQPGANIIDTVDRVRAEMPQLQSSIPATIKMSVLLDQTTTIRASVRDVEFTLLISIVLVVLVVFVFLRDWRVTLIPSVAVPVSLIGTFGVMYLFGYSLDNLSLMALTISTGFVVDDAIVVIENISRYREQGLSSLDAALRGAREIGFTVFSISVSLIAVFIPILMMGGIVGRLFREFAVTLSTAIAVSLLVSMITTPMMCAYLLGPTRRRATQGGATVIRLEPDETSGRLLRANSVASAPSPVRGRWYQASGKAFDWALGCYEVSLTWMLRHSGFTLGLALATAALSAYLFIVIPKGFFPEQDTGRLMGSIVADQDASFQTMQSKLTQFVAIVIKDPAVAHVVGSTGSNAGGSAANSARMFISLKPLDERNASAVQVIARLRKNTAKISGAALYLQAAQDLRVGGRSANAEYQYTIESDDLEELNHWGPLLLQKLRTIPQLTDVNSDQQNGGLEAGLVVDRDVASRLQLSQQLIDNTLYDAFGQREVSTLYTALNQYYVVMEVAPQFWQDPQSLQLIDVRPPNGTDVQLSTFTHFAPSTTPLVVNHQGQFPAVTISFNLKSSVALSQAVTAIGAAAQQLGVPGSIQGSFAGTAQAFQVSLAGEPILILAALGAVYVVLGILYESYVHPITILLTLPSAGVGALVALLLFHIELSVIALIGIILLIGIVKKNAIMLIDFALQAEREEGKTSVQAIREACLLRFRPIMMTTMAALFGALPLAIGSGTGSELRRPLGIAIVGGLLVSQLLTLYTTPVIYLYLDRLRLWWADIFKRRHAVIAPAPI